MRPPLLATVRVHRCEGRDLRLHVPLFLLWLLLLPFALVVLPVAFVALLALDLDPVLVFGALGGLIAAISGTHIEVESPTASVFIHVV